MATFSFIFNQRNRENWVGWGGDSRVLRQTFPGLTGSVRRCVVLKQQPVLLSPKFGEKSSHIFTQSSLNITVEYAIDCLTYQDEFFMSTLHFVRENYEHALNFVLRLPRPFSLSVHLDSNCTAHDLPVRLSNHCQGLRPT
jgi:hypothetical protein